MARGAVDAVLAVEVGPQFVKGVLVDRDGVTHRSDQVPAPIGVGDAAAVEAIRELARAISRDSRGTRIVGGCVVVPGIVDAVAGVARYSAEFGWHNVPLAQLVGSDVRAPIVLDHSVRAAAMAEGDTGAARGVQDWVYVSVGTSIGAAAVVAGKLHRGATGAAGEFGHLPIYPFGEQCACGQRGCVEAYAGTAAVSARYERVSGATLGIAQIAQLVGRDPLADEVWTHAVAALGLALTSYTMIEDPELIVIGGELAGVADVALPSLRGELRQRLLWRQPPRMVVARLGGDAPLAGAVALGWAAAGQPG